MSVLITIVMVRILVMMVARLTRTHHLCRSHHHRPISAL